jgi:hypothetical protein
MKSSRSAGRRRQRGTRFMAQFVCATLVVIAAVAVGVAIEHSALAREIAPSSYYSSQAQLIFRSGRPYQEVTVIAHGRRTVTIHPIPLAKSALPRNATRANDSGWPVDLSSWPQLLQTLVPVVALALAVAGLDGVRRRLVRRSKRRMALNQS